MKKFKMRNILICFLIFTVGFTSAILLWNKSRCCEKHSDSKTNLKLSPPAASQNSKSYKVVKIAGGLGNQMFQYAFGYALARESGVKVLYDLSFYDEEKNNPISIEKARESNQYIGNVRRVFGLDNFNVECEVATQNQIKNCGSETVGEEEVKYTGISNYNDEKNEKFLGYWETLSLYNFETYRNDFSKMFSLKAPLNEVNQKMMHEIQECNSVSIHIRRTDHGVLSFTTLDYYKEAVDYVCSKVQDPKFYIFSDDLNWVRENFKIDKPYVLVDINNDETNYLDLELMKNCKHNIIANSTFSWWAAWLNSNKDKIVIAPKIWHNGDHRNHMIPKSWVRL